ncbi:hypothetical protein AQ490_20745 [Wenjunlia vitaminophila]|uniref:Peptidase S8/S53 domain-containing protein n=1 Tax=Wenjunlia vitaminophila TaxID=76728 RepID=A0A0T6LTD5_WENVI|nr:hypothetical protein AQ490_20745 [Wenjunlia vitaminophila]
MAVGASLPGLAGTAGAQAAPSATVETTPVVQSPSTASSAQVTLVTGDVVTVTTQAGGEQAVDIQPAKGTAKTFQTLTDPDGDVYVIPSDAVEGLAAQSLDRRLFNVTQLIRDGHGDAESDQLPVIVSYGDAPSRATLNKRVDALPASERGAVTDRLDLAGVRIEKSAAQSFWRSAKPVATKGDGARASAASSSRVTKIWYDAPVRVTLDKSVPQISAPKAWEAGYDGKGTKVAVLDTGADTNHPDIKDRIVGSASFVPGEEVADGHGHGTHVASTIAGTGAASGGKYKGVAPAADLLVGKVLSNGGTGDASGILAGMEWAVNQDADVVSMSLGAPAYGSGDILSEAVDQLSAQSDTLFVIAAGNDGPNEFSLGSPGIADSALTVGAVTKSDVLASFSSRGPRLDDFAIKPDITAPGVGIVAARASGTAMGTPVDQSYTSANGTSMATPHVAGAAAILAQRHPDWDGERIKAALTSHSVASPDYTPYEQGNGRVDVAAALSPELELTGTADFGLVPWSKDTAEKLTRTLTLTNSSGTDTTATLSTDLPDTLPEGAVTLSATEVAIPAGGSVEVQVTLDPNGVPTNQRYTGTITATTATGATAHTAFGYVQDTERYDLTIDLKGRNGKAPYQAVFFVMGLDNDSFNTGMLAGEDSLTVRVPPGKYGIAGSLATTGEGKATVVAAQDLFQIPEVEVRDQARDVTVDASEARDITMEVEGLDRPVEDNVLSYIATRVREDRMQASAGLASGATWSDTRYGSIPWDAPATGEARGTFFHGVREPLVRATVTRPDELALDTKVSPYGFRFTGKKQYDLVDVGDGSAEQIAGKDLTGKAAVVHKDAVTEAGYLLASLKEAGAAAVIVVPNDDSSQQFVVRGEIPSVAVSYQDGRALAERLAKGRTTVTLQGVRNSRYAYSGQWDHSGAMQAGPTLNLRADEIAKVTNRLHSDGTYRVGFHTINSWGAQPITSYRAAEISELGHERVEYLRTAPGLRYTQSVGQSLDVMGEMREATLHSYRAGKAYREDWYGTPMHPSNASAFSCNYCRTERYTVLGALPGGDSDPDHFLAWGRTQRMTYYRNGELITDPGNLMVKEKAQYRFVQETSRPRDVPGLVLAPTTRTEFTFTSAQPTTESTGYCQDLFPGTTHCEPLPVVLLDYDMKADLLNEVGAGSPYSFTVNASRAKGWTGSTAMAGAKVSISTDDGATWTPVKVGRVDGDSFRASYRNPGADKKFVSVKVEVWDGDGNRTEQTIVKAYGLR